MKNEFLSESKSQAASRRLDGFFRDWLRDHPESPRAVLKKKHESAMRAKRDPALDAAVMGVPYRLGHMTRLLIPGGFCDIPRDALELPDLAGPASASMLESVDAILKSQGEPCPDPDMPVYNKDGVTAVFKLTESGGGITKENRKPFLYTLDGAVRFFEKSLWVPFTWSMGFEAEFTTGWNPFRCSRRWSSTFSEETDTFSDGGFILDEFSEEKEDEHNILSVETITSWEFGASVGAVLEIMGNEGGLSSWKTDDNLQEDSVWGRLGPFPETAENVTGIRSSGRKLSRKMAAEGFWARLRKALYHRVNTHILSEACPKGWRVMNREGVTEGVNEGYARTFKWVSCRSSTLLACVRSCVWGSENVPPRVNIEITTGADKPGSPDMSLPSPASLETLESQLPSGKGSGGLGDIKIRLLEKVLTN